MFPVVCSLLKAVFGAVISTIPNCYRGCGRGNPHHSVISHFSFHRGSGLPAWVTRVRQSDVPPSQPSSPERHNNAVTELRQRPNNIERRDLIAQEQCKSERLAHILSVELKTPSSVVRVQNSFWWGKRGTKRVVHVHLLT